MSIRRCPGCKNLVEKQSVTCPICGRSYASILVGRVLRWALIVVLVALAFKTIHSI